MWRSAHQVSNSGLHSRRTNQEISVVVMGSWSVFDVSCHGLKQGRMLIVPALRTPDWSNARPFSPILKFLLVLVVGGLVIVLGAVPAMALGLRLN